jgi:hypothetical protein
LDGKGKVKIQLSKFEGKNRLNGQGSGNAAIRTFEWFQPDPLMLPTTREITHFTFLFYFLRLLTSPFYLSNDIYSP